MARKQSRASVMSVQTNEMVVGGPSEGTGPGCSTPDDLKVLTLSVWLSHCSYNKGDKIIILVANC